MWGYDLSTYGRVAWTSPDGPIGLVSLADAALGAGMPTRSPWSFGRRGRRLDRKQWGGRWRRAVAIRGRVSWTRLTRRWSRLRRRFPVAPVPAQPTTLQQLIDIGPFKAAACFGQTPSPYVRIAANCDGCGGTGFPWRHSPALDRERLRLHPGTSASHSHDSGGPGTPWAFGPCRHAHLTLPTEGTPVSRSRDTSTIPVSPDCRIIPIEVDAELPPLSVAEAARRRQAFVVTSFKVAGG